MTTLRTGLAAELLHPRPTTTQTLDAVEVVLRDRLDDLVRHWAGETAHEDPLLGGTDVPDLLRDLVLAGGKRLRPGFVHCGWAAVGGAPDHTDVVALGAALELLHAFGLVQDDVMDRSATRRGVTAVHRRAQRLHESATESSSLGPEVAVRYGESIAVLVGDLAHAEADALVADLPPAVRERWRRLCVELVRGQARDLSLAAHRATPDAVLAVTQAWEVARAKSGAYTVQRPLELGGVLGGAGPDALGSLSAAGRLLGEAFALRDDLLGVWGDPASTGKPVGDDLRQAKPTVIVALAEQRLRGPDLEALRRLARHQHGEAEVEQVTTAMVAAGIRDEVEAMVHERRCAAEERLAVPGLDPDGVAAVLELADAVVGVAS